MPTGQQNRRINIRIGQQITTLDSANNWRNVHWNVSQKMYKTLQFNARLKVIATTILTPTPKYQQNWRKKNFHFVFAFKVFGSVSYSLYEFEFAELRERNILIFASSQGSHLLSSVIWCRALGCQKLFIMFESGFSFHGIRLTFQTSGAIKSWIRSHWSLQLYALFVFVFTT